MVFMASMIRMRLTRATRVPTSTKGARPARRAVGGADHRRLARRPDAWPGRPPPSSPRPRPAAPVPCWTALRRHAGCRPPASMATCRATRTRMPSRSISISLEPGLLQQLRQLADQGLIGLPFPFMSFAMRRSSAPFALSSLAGSRTPAASGSVRSHGSAWTSAAVSKLLYGKRWESRRPSAVGPFISFPAPVKGRRCRFCQSRFGVGLNALVTHGFSADLAAFLAHLARRACRAARSGSPARRR